MGGFFLDDMIRGIVRNVRRESRRSDAAKWTIVEGTIKGFRAEDEYWNKFRPVIDYSYETQGETGHGFAAGYAISRDHVDKVGDAVDALPGLKVRVDPKDFCASRVLNEDNPKLPFAVDHDRA